MMVRGGLLVARHVGQLIVRVSSIIMILNDTRSFRIFQHMQARCMVTGRPGEREQNDTKGHRKDNHQPSNPVFEANHHREN